MSSIHALHFVISTPFHGFSAMWHGQISEDTPYVICLTCRNLLPTRALIDQVAQLAQPIGPEDRTTSTDRDYKVRLHNVGPLDR
jgi:hypothetical protein